MGTGTARRSNGSRGGGGERGTATGRRFPPLPAHDVSSAAAARAGRGGWSWCCPAPRQDWPRGEGGPGEFGLPRGQAPCTTAAKSSRTPVLEPPSPVNGAGGRPGGKGTQKGVRRTGNPGALPRCTPLPLGTPGPEARPGSSGDNGARPSRAWRCHPREAGEAPPPRHPQAGRPPPPRRHRSPRPTAQSPRTTL